MAGLGYERYGAQGGDWGSMISTQLGLADPEHVAGVHLNMIVAPPPADLDFEHLRDDEQAALASFELLRAASTRATRRSRARSRRPSATRSTTRPPGWRRGSSRSSGPGATATATSSAASPRTSCSTTSCCTGSPPPPTRPGASTTRPSRRAGFVPDQRVEVPFGVAAFPKEIIRSPRHWAERRYDIRALDRDAPRRALRGVRRAGALLVDDVREFFRPAAGPHLSRSRTVYLYARPEPGGVQHAAVRGEWPASG